MMRAALILVGVGSLFAIERGTPPRVAKAVDQPPTQSTVGVSDLRDTLKADRLEIPYFQNELPTQPISFELTPPADSTPVISKEASKVVSGDRHDAETRKIAFVHPRPRPKIPDSHHRFQHSREYISPEGAYGCCAVSAKRVRSLPQSIEPAVRLRGLEPAVH